MFKKISWRSLYFDGNEELEYEIKRGGLDAHSKVTWVDDQNQAHRLKYTVACYSDWSTKYIEVSKDGQGKQLVLQGDGEGNWQDDHGHELTEVSGCIDIDFQATPFTNILPVRRLPNEIGRRQHTKVVYITFPELYFYPVEQYYTKLNDQEWLFEQPQDNFKAKIQVDKAGLVTDYPGLFQRI